MVSAKCNQSKRRVGIKLQLARPINCIYIATFAMRVQARAQQDVDKNQTIIEYRTQRIFVDMFFEYYST